MCKIQFDEPLWFLNIVGLNPLNTNKFSKLRRFVSISISLGIFCSGILESIVHFEGLETCSRASESMIVQYQLLFKVSVILIHEKEIIQLINQSSEFFPVEGKIKYSSSYIHKILRQFFLIYRIMLILMAMQYILRKFVMKTDKPLAIFYGEQNGFTPMQDRIIFVYHSIGTIVVFYIIVGFDGLFFYFIGYILAEIKMIKNFFKVVKYRENELFEVIRHHQFVLSYIQRLNLVYSRLLLNQHLTCLFGICFGLFLLSQDGLPPDFGHITSYLPYVLSFTTQTFTFCYIGSLIIDWTLEIPDVIFYYDWSQKKTYYKEKIIAIERGQRAAKLTLGGFASLDLNSFSVVIKNSFSFFTFINAMQNKKKI